MRPAAIANVIDSSESSEANSWTLSNPNGAKSFFNGGQDSGFALGRYRSPTN